MCHKCTAPVVTILGPILLTVYSASTVISFHSYGCQKRRGDASEVAQKFPRLPVRSKFQEFSKGERSYHGEGVFVSTTKAHEIVGVGFTLTAHLYSGEHGVKQYE